MSFIVCIPCSAARFALVCTLSGLPAAAATAQGVACDAMAQQALNLRAFRKAVDAYANLLPQPEAASALLVCLQRGNRELAETLMLHQRRLRAPVRSDAVVEGAFLHYVINTNEPRLDEQETADLERLARSYRQSLLPAAEPDADAQASCDPPPWTDGRSAAKTAVGSNRKFTYFSHGRTLNRQKRSIHAPCGGGGRGFETLTAHQEHPKHSGDSGQKSAASGRRIHWCH
jgi:hypothetical protein